MDLVYYDPPYNKHPYCIYYFLLDIVNNWNTDMIYQIHTEDNQKVEKIKLLQQKTRKKKFEDLILNTNSKYILLSYNNGGIIPLNDLDSILNKYGTVEKIPVTHKTYNNLKGIANYKRKEEKKRN